MDVATALGLSPNLPPVVFSLISAGVVYGALYWVLNTYGWKMGPIAKVLKVPDISGDWRCSGKSLNAAREVTYEWEGTVTIVQRWDRLRVRLRTSQSGSQSVSAAILHDEADGWRLMYHYRNDPKIDEPELKAHRGFAELVFDRDLTGAHGEYFNGDGRFTFGTMQLTRPSMEGA